MLALPMSGELVQLPLRKKGPLVESFQMSTRNGSEPPRALKSLARIVDGDLCHRCGSCVGICPTNVLGLDKGEYPTVENLSACTDCDLCVKVCPGTDFDVRSISQQMFGYEPDIEDMHGHFDDAFLSHANDEGIREHSTSGGLVTALLISLLEQNVVDGAVVIASDEDALWKGKPIVARTPEEVLSATKSKYAISPTNSVFQEIRNISGRYALVGLPCQIHGFHKAARIDKRIRDRVIVTIGLFCHAAVEHEPMRYIWSTLDRGTRKQATRFVSRVDKHPGTPHVMLDDGSSSPIYFPEKKGYRPSSMEIMNILYRLYTPARCLTCYDATAEFADIAVGDPWMAPPDDDINFYEGYSFALARTNRAKELLHLAEDAGAITLKKLRRDVARTCNTLMGEEKRWRAFRILETRRRQGFAVPDYGIETPKSSGKQFMLTEANMLSHILCFLPIGKLNILKFVFSPAGYALLWLNNKRRRFRDWRRDSWFWIKRKVFGKSGFDKEQKEASL